MFYFSQTTIRLIVRYSPLDLRLLEVRGSKVPFFNDTNKPYLFNIFKEVQQVNISQIYTRNSVYLMVESHLIHEYEKY